MWRGRLSIVACIVCVGVAGYLARARDDVPQQAAAKQTAAEAPQAAAEDMARAANNFLAALNADQQKQATFEFRNEERYNWHFIPRERKGLPVKEMAPEQRPLAHALLSSGLGQRAYGQVETIMSLEQILKEMEQGKGPVRDPERYFFSVFGKPGGNDAWGWRVEGHHVSLNFTVVNGRVVAGTPAFLGSNPGEVREGPRKGLRVLAAEEDLGRQLARSLDEQQKKDAILPGEAPKEIITGNSRKAMLEHAAGLTADRFTPQQKQLLTSLLELYARRLRPELAEQDLRKVTEAGMDKVRFAWAGELEPGRPHYYRLHGPTFLVEYDNTQNNANHIHTVWRDLTNDFGDDALKRHYDQTPHTGR
jgi:hypothetical protein